MNTLNRRVAAFAAAATVATGLAVATQSPLSVSAWDDCGDRVLSTPFTRWGDDNAYFLVSSGDFESGRDGWGTSGDPVVVADQEPWKINGTDDSSALMIPVGTAARSPRMCVESNEESVRFFYRSPGVPGAKMKVTVEIDGKLGFASTTWIADGSQDRWRRSPRISMPNLRFANGRQYIVIRFTPIGTEAPWTIDDVMVDPFVSR